MLYIVYTHVVYSVQHSDSTCLYAILFLASFKIFSLSLGKQFDYNVPCHSFYHLLFICLRFMKIPGSVGLLSSSSLEKFHPLYLQMLPSMYSFLRLQAHVY